MGTKLYSNIDVTSLYVFNELRVKNQRANAYSISDICEYFRKVFSF